MRLGWWIIPSVIGGAAVWALLATAALAQQQCGPRAAVVETLARKYAETRRAIGMAANGTVMEVYAGDAGTWTITVTSRQGLTCLVASGTGYEAVTEPLPPNG